MLCFILHARLRVHLASGIPCALLTKGAEKFLQNSGARRREIVEAYPVIASESEAIQNLCANAISGLLRRKRSSK
jgi:hypothetical protein